MNGRACVLAALSIGACHQDTGFLDASFACTDDSECIADYACHPGQRVCVEATTIGIAQVAIDRVEVRVGVVGFRADRTEVRVRDYGQCVLAGACQPPTCASFDLDAPVHCVTWFDARAYCEWSSGRLPTQLEWELAAVGTATAALPFPWGTALPSCGLAVLDDGCGDGRVATVGSRPGGASPFGLLDMVGNVAEWLGDDAIDQLRVIRGGSYQEASNSEIIRPRSTTVESQAPSFFAETIGFRCVTNL